MNEIRIKQRRAVTYVQDEEVYTPETIRELWSEYTPESCLVLALLEKWETARAEMDKLRTVLNEALDAWQGWVETESQYVIEEDPGWIRIQELRSIGAK